MKIPKTLSINICMDEPTAEELTQWAAGGGSFDWLADEPDLYDETCGEPKDLSPQTSSKELLD